VTGVAIVTVVAGDGRYRAITVSSFQLVSAEPPIVAISFSHSISFHEALSVGGSIGVSVLEWEHEFLADRAAGRGPVPDGTFSGIPHDLLTDGVPVIRGALARCVCRVQRLDDVGDHVLMLAEVIDGDLPPDTDDPLLRYGGRYRRLEAE
jgi:flavin reductase (DIM6/NTAB) family NADH-FMN oxidoreductase RutF